MVTKYYPPEFKQEQFNCALCGVYAAQSWSQLFNGYSRTPVPLFASTCQHCDKSCYWHSKRMIVPDNAVVALPHPDLPFDCLADYDEARSIVGRSPRAAAALLRLCVQRLMVALGQTGKNIDDDIRALVRAGLPTEVQQALDYCRVVGNNAVHPGEIVFDEGDNIARSLFDMVNFVVEDRISRPKKIAALYAALPEKARLAVEKKDGKSIGG